MTLHQLTQSATLDLDFGITTALRQGVAQIQAFIQHWSARNRLAAEMAQLDHRERADLAVRR